jgi:hypothetical protein
MHVRARVFASLLAVVTAVSGVSLVSPTGPAAAANAADFDPGNIMSDAVFYNDNSMTVDQIQAFLNARVPACRSGYTCLKDYREQTVSRSAVTGLCSAYAGANDSSAQIISKVGTACGINPQVLIVLLEKEQSLVTDSWPTAGQYRSATGFGCPDTSACDSEYYGFFNQVYNAAKQFKKYQATPSSWSYQAGRINTILWSPDRSCGTSQVYIQNQATAGLYIYTPYRPNQAALNNLYGTGDACSTYGNRNFWRIFTDWFGSTTRSSTVPIVGVGDFNGDGKPDFVARRPDGTLWLYAGTGAVTTSNQGYSPASQIGTGWNIFDAIIGSGDFNGDRNTDIVARKPDGTLWLYPGNGKGGFLPASQIGSGWDVFTEITGPGDFNGDGKPDLLGRKPDGSLWLYPGNGAGGFQPQSQIGSSGWDSYAQLLGVGDLNRDGHPDLVGMRPDGTLWFYAGTGTGTGYAAAQNIPAAGVGAFDTLVAPGDLNSDGYPDLLARSADGTLKFISGGTIIQSGLLPAKTIGSSWNIYTKVLTVPDFNGDGKPDLLGVKPDGSLWFYAGHGDTTYSAGTMIGGSGWNAYSKIISVGDFNGDQKPDLLAIRPNGSLWFYAGTGQVNSASNGYQPGQQIGGSG